MRQKEVILFLGKEDVKIYVKTSFEVKTAISTFMNFNSLVNNNHRENI